MIRNKDDYLRVVIFCLFLAVAYQFILSPLKIFNTQRQWFEDFLTHYNYKTSAKVSPKDILIVKIDDNSINTIGIKWPWPRKIFAQAVDILSEHKASVVAFDLIFSGKSSFGDEDDAILSSSIRNSGKVVLAAYFNSLEGSLVPIDELSNVAKYSGYVNKLKDKDSLVRRVQCLYLAKDGKEDYPFEFKTLALFFGFEPKEIVFERGKIIFPGTRIKTIPLAGGITADISYRYNFNDFESISFSDLLEGKFSDESIQDKIVIISQTAEILHDVHQTPLGSMPGAGILANFTKQILDGTTLANVKPAVNFIALFLILLLVGISALILQATGALVLDLVVNLAVIIFAVKAYQNDLIVDIFGFVFSLSFVLFAVWCYRYILFVQNKNRLLRLAILDIGSGLFNHHYFSVKLQDESRQAQLKNRSLCCVMFLLRNYTQFISEFDKTEVDVFLKRFVKVIKDICPKRVFMARFSEDKVCILTSNINRVKFDKIIELLNKSVSHLFIKSDLKQTSKEANVIIGAYFQDKNSPKAASLIIHYLEEALRAAENSDEKLSVVIAPKEKENIDLQEKPRAGKDDLLGFMAEDIDERNRQLLEKIEELKLAHKKTEDAYISTLKSLLEALEAKDSYTSGHSVRVAEYALDLGRRLKFRDEKLINLERAALLHDIGKIGLKDEILHKKGKLSNEEYDLIKKHEIESVKILEPIEFLKRILPGILHHHEHFDGSGYPHGLRGDMIPVESRIIAIADTFDAMTTGRGYNNPLDKNEAIINLRACAGKQLDPGLVEEFIKVLSASSI